MRDLYNRKQKLEHWIEKAKTTLDEPDRTHILKNNVESISQYHHISYNYINWLIK
jgi:hypothetical protein